MGDRLSSKPLHPGEILIESLRVAGGTRSRVLAGTPRCGRVGAGSVPGHCPDTCAREWGVVGFFACVYAIPSKSSRGGVGGNALHVARAPTARATVS